jgi:hypothetical protein
VDEQMRDRRRWVRSEARSAAQTLKWIDEWQENLLHQADQWNRWPVWPSYFELMAAALRLHPNRAEDPACEDFRCGAVVEHLADNAVDTREALPALLADYLSDGFPVIAAMDPQVLDRQYGKRVPPPAGSDHAVLIVGYHLARPSEAPRGGATYAQSADAFVLSDLTNAPFLKVSAEELHDALLRPLRDPDTGRDIRRAELLVVVPRGVVMSAFDAKRLTLAAAPFYFPPGSGVDAKDFADPRKFTVRAALFTADRALRRFSSVVPDDEAARGGWQAYCGAVHEHDAVALAGGAPRRHFWNVEIHCVGQDPYGRELVPWVPHRPLCQFYWPADREVRGLGELAPEVSLAEPPSLVAVRRDGWRVLLHAPRPSAADGVGEGVWASFEFRLNGEPTHV